LAVCEAKDRVTVPLLVMGDPLTVRMLGADNATLVTPLGVDSLLDI
jgi:hypothetical protein